MSEDLTTRKCGDCGEEKPLHLFYLKRNRLDKKCKSCCIKRTTDYSLKRKKIGVQPKSPKILIGNKECNTCREFKDIKQFYYITKTNNYSNNCRICIKLNKIKARINKKRINNLIKEDYLEARIKMENGKWLYLKEVTDDDIKRLLIEGYRFVLTDNYYQQIYS